MVPIKERKVKLGKTHYLNVMEAGKGPVVLFVHGGAGCWNNFSRQIQPIAENYHIVAPDLRGHGKSPWLPQSTVDDFFDDLVQMIDNMGIRGPFCMVGHSFGGYLTARYSAEYPENVAGLVLLNTSGSLKKGLAYKFLERFSGGADAVHKRYPWLCNTSSQVATCLMKQTFNQWDCWKKYTQIKAKTLVVLGAFDPLVNVTHGRLILSRIPNASLKILPTGGHVSMCDKPQLVTKLIKDHLDSSFAQVKRSSPLVSSQAM